MYPHTQIKSPLTSLTLSFCNLKQFNGIVDHQSKILDIVLFDKEDNTLVNYPSSPISKEDSHHPVLGIFF